MHGIEGPKMSFVRDRRCGDDDGYPTVQFGRYVSLRCSIVRQTNGTGGEPFLSLQTRCRPRTVLPQHC